ELVTVETKDGPKNLVGSLSATISRVTLDRTKVASRCTDTLVVFSDATNQERPGGISQVAVVSLDPLLGATQPKSGLRGTKPNKLTHLVVEESVGDNLPVTLLREAGEHLTVTDQLLSL